ncbi:metallo-beta-lactamase domain-containing protein 1-like isoform X1 [Biomphalaria glabrata]|nr:metallo-beta-lactamase domain-containing protein 1-like isoform X1 [Biomphalaria glabrata]
MRQKDEDALQRKVLREKKKGMPFNIDEDVEIGPTPGHTGNDVSVVVKKANLGVLAGGIYFIVKDMDLRLRSHKAIKSQRILDEHEEHISSPQMTTSTSELDEKLYWTKGTAEIDEENRGDGNEVELEEQKRTKENLRKRMREVKELDITTDNLVKSLESSLKEKEHEVKQEQQRNRELDAKFKNLLQEKESIEAQLQKILDNHYTAKSELSSKIKSLQEEKKKLKDELVALEKLNAQLVEESNHINTNQKIQLCDKKNQENNEPTKVKEQNKQCEHLSDSDSTEIDLKTWDGSCNEMITTRIPITWLYSTKLDYSKQ